MRPGVKTPPNSDTCRDRGNRWFDHSVRDDRGHALCQAALIKNISELYLGREATVGQSYRYVIPKLLTLIGAGILVTLVVSMGYILLIVPGVIFTLWLALTPSVDRGGEPGEP